MEQRWPWAQKQFEGHAISKIGLNYFFRTKEQLHTMSQQHPGTDSGKSRTAVVTDFLAVEIVEELAFFPRLLKVLLIKTLFFSAAIEMLCNAFKYE